MPTDEKRAFAERLKLALTRSPKPIDSSAELALQFNLRHPDDPVTQQAVHKWLTGKTRPTPDKIDTLAMWLGVSAHWLRFGAPDDARGMAAESLCERREQAGFFDEARLLADMRRLSPHQRSLIIELVGQLLLERGQRS